MNFSRRVLVYKIFYVSFLFVFVEACATLNPIEVPPTVASAIYQQPGWSMVFHDEFDTAEFNHGVWATKYRWGPVNFPELQYYSKDSISQNNGILYIKAMETPSHGMRYSSGLIASYDSFSFTYGYVEIKIRVPSGQGLWPALWLLYDGPASDEIDIMEILGNQPNVIYMTLHFDDKQGIAQSTGGSYAGPDFSADFHVFAIDWKKDMIIWYVDGVEKYKLTENIPQVPMYLIANLAVGGEWPGSPDNTTQFPATFEIDYIRIFQR